MNGLWGKSEPVVIDEEILQKAITKQLPDEQARSISKSEGINFCQIRKLYLEYMNIFRISHLWQFTSLSRLYLNGNVIEKIDGLDRLVNLTWLSLSFNNIKKIEGLGSLMKLEVLNLTNNKISVIENMDTLDELTHFGLANNCFEQIENVLYLRRFKNLFNINLYGNPASVNEDYKYVIIVYLPKLRSLDNRLIDEKTRNEACIEHPVLFETTRLEELQIEQDEEDKKKQEAELKLHVDAFVECLNGSFLFKSMVKDDPEAEALQSVPGVAPLLQTYPSNASRFEHQVVELCVQLFETGLTEHKLRETEVSSFHSGQRKTMADFQQRASQILAKFEKQHKERMVEMQQISEPDQLKVESDRHNEVINQVEENLMALEVQMDKQNEDFTKTFDITISDMVGNFSEAAQGIFAQCRDLENDYHQKVKEVVVATVENVAKDQLEEDLPDEVTLLLTDKDKVMDALTAAHKKHLLRINDRETQLVTRADAWKVALIKEIQDEELKQNRSRISNICRYANHYREQLEHPEIYFKFFKTCK